MTVVQTSKPSTLQRKNVTMYAWVLGRWFLVVIQLFSYRNLVNYTKIGLGLFILFVSFLIHGTILLLLLPSRTWRIKACNYYGSIIGRTLVALVRCRVTLVGGENFDGNRPAIYVSNHTSLLDIFLAIWLSPTGTVGIAKKEVIYYPFFGQLYYLSGHLRIDRGNSEKAVESLNELAEIVEEKKLSIFLWPEGTRSRTGRLMPFKKGLYHLAVQTGLPVVPMVVKGAHKSWEKNSMRVHGVPVEVEALPAIDTSDWANRSIEDALGEVHSQFKNSLPEEQKPLPHEDRPLK